MRSHSVTSLSPLGSQSRTLLAAINRTNQQWRLKLQEPIGPNLADLRQFQKQTIILEGANEPVHQAASRTLAFQDRHFDLAQTSLWVQKGTPTVWLTKTVFKKTPFSTEKVGTVGLGLHINTGQNQIEDIFGFERQATFNQIMPWSAFVRVQDGDENDRLRQYIRAFRYLLNGEILMDQAFTRMPVDNITRSGFFEPIDRQEDRILLCQKLDYLLIRTLVP